MASQLYESVTANDAKRDALKKKAKSLSHPQTTAETNRRARKAIERRKEIAAKHSGNGAAAPRGTATAATSGTKPTEKRRQPAHPSSSQTAAGYQRQAAAKTPSLAAKKIADQPKETKVAVRSGDTPPSALGPQRPSGTDVADSFIAKRSSEFIPNIKKDFNAAADFIKGNIKANQQRYESAVKDRIRSGREAGAAVKTQPRGQTSATDTPAPSPGTITKPADTKIAKPAAVSKPVRPKGSAGAASNKDLPGKTTITYAPPKKDKVALAAASKQSLADSKVAAAVHRNGPGGGASTVLSAYRGETSHFKKREK